MASRLQEYLLQQPLYAAGANASEAGTSMAPVRSPWEGLARALQGGIGGAMQGYALSEAKGAQKKDNAALAAYMKSPDDLALAAAAADHPAFATVSLSRMNAKEKIAAALEARTQQAADKENFIRLAASLKTGHADPMAAITAREAAQEKLADHKAGIAAQRQKELIDQMPVLGGTPVAPPAAAPAAPPAAMPPSPSASPVAPPAFVPPSASPPPPRAPPQGVPADGPPVGQKAEVPIAPDEIAQGDGTGSPTPRVAADGRVTLQGLPWLQSNIDAYNAARAAGDHKKMIDMLHLGGQEAAAALQAAETANTPKPMPPHAEQGLTKNFVALNQIDKGLSELKKNPDAVGWLKGVMSSTGDLSGSNLADRLDPKGVDARAPIANIGSLIIHDRSGAAVTISEMPRLRPFIPVVGDDPGVIEKKMLALRSAITDEMQATNDYYSPKNRFIPHQASVRRQVEAPPAPLQIPQQAADMLKANPASREHFDQTFGPGSAARVLGQ